jgi:hypothetical protein
LLGNEGYALCATTMCPPFDPDKYIQGTKNLMLEYPCCKEVKDFLSGEEL